jgi:YjbE family integral membrane protein
LSATQLRPSPARGAVFRETGPVVSMLHFTLAPHFWMGLWRIILVNVLLSGDNAVVIALACRNLSDRYRNPAVLGGTAGAVIVRVAFCFVITWLLAIPAVKLIGGALLLWIGVKLMVPEEGDGDDGVKGHSGLFAAIQTIVIADVVMSLDNVIAIAAAAKGDMTLIVLGLVLSVPVIIFGSQLVLKLLNRMPILVVAGAGLLGWLAGEIAATDLLVHRWLPELGHWGERMAAVIGAAFVVGLGLLLKRRAEAQHAPLEDLRVEDGK